MRTEGMSAPSLTEISASGMVKLVLAGSSPIDGHGSLGIHTLESAENIISSYGFCLENSIQSAELLGHFHEALHFIRKYFLKPSNPDGLDTQLPRKIVELLDMRQLVLMAHSGAKKSHPHDSTLNLQHWACSILKIMHTLVHIDRDIRSPHFSDIQKQIFDRFYKHISRDD